MSLHFVRVPFSSAKWCPCEAVPLLILSLGDLGCLYYGLQNAAVAFVMCM